ncbi:MAG: extensin family protein [Sphingomonas sp.]|uniref:extensin-like domain-containing protein n=1 Tax=Sphingomonas sp. TaxID=28214 RepID=UPI001B023F96|nr:extensin family protein [Sphingomonas sp.]MBO9624414.1 extensin family protein [Sphingomonas sp.]
MKALRRALRAAAIGAALLALAFILYALLRSRPQDLPWTRLDLGQPIGLFTGRKLAGLTQDFQQCRALLAAAGVRYTPLAQVEAGESCGYSDGVRLTVGGSRSIGFSPPNLGVSCPVAAALAMWEWNVVQPAAQRHFGQPVATIEHLGSYSCRRMYGRSIGDWSEHATADAIDVAGFRLKDGTRIRVLADWKGEGAKAAFQHEVRDGACRLFATVLSPDYNAAHRDHLHLDQAERGEMGWRACR